MVISPAVLAPAITYGTGGSLYTTTSASTGSVTTNYRVERWNTNTACNTITDGWDTGNACCSSSSAGSSTTTGGMVVEMNHIQYQTLDMPYVQVAQGPGYTIRAVRYNNGVADTTWYGSYIIPQKTPAERLKEILNSRMAPSVLSNCRPLGLAKDIREVRARETLLRVLGEDRFRDFVRRGSVSVRAKSGLVYQIFPGSDFTKVYDNGKMVDRLCVVLLGGFPPTDSLIMRYLLILNNEAFFRSKAIKHGISGYGTSPTNPDNRSLVEIYREIKGNAA